MLTLLCDTSSSMCSCHPLFIQASVDWAGRSIHFTYYSKVRSSKDLPFVHAVCARDGWMRLCVYVLLKGNNIISQRPRSGSQQQAASFGLFIYTRFHVVFLDTAHGTWNKKFGVSCFMFHVPLSMSPISILDTSWLQAAPPPPSNPWKVPFWIYYSMLYLIDICLLLRTGQQQVLLYTW